MASLPDIEKLCMNCMNAKPDAAAACPQCGYPAGGYAASSDELAPRTILFGRFLMGRLTARGNIGILYAAYDLKCCQRVTIREYFPKAYAKREQLRPGVSRVVPINGEAAQPFQSGLEQSEAKAQQLMRLGGLSGLYVPKKCFLENGTAYTVLDYVRGITLRQIDRNGAPSAADAPNALRPLVASLAYMHGTDVYHGELSPGQILFTPEGKFKLLPPWGAPQPELGVKDNGQNARSAQEFAAAAVRDTRALCAAFYTLLAGKEPPPFQSCKSVKDIPSLSGMGVPISRQKENAICKGLCGGYQDARELHWALYGATPTEVGAVRGRDNNATASLEKAVKTISGGGGKKARPAPKIQNSSPYLVAYAAASMLQLAAAVFFMANGGGQVIYVLLPCAVLNGLRLLRGSMQRPFVRMLHLTLTAGATVFAGYVLFALTPGNGLVQGILAASCALLLLNAVCILIETILKGAHKKAPQ